MKEKLKRNYKLVIAFVIGVIVSLGSTYAATTISSSDISYDNSTSGLTSTNMKGAIDELYEKVNNKPCKVIKGTGMDANDEIKCGTEEFYVMGTTGGNSIVTLTKYPIEGGASSVDFTSSDVSVEYINDPSYAQNKNCGNDSFLCYGSGFADNYKSVLEKIGLSDSIEVKKPSLSDLNKVGCSFSYTSTGMNPPAPSGSCEKFPWLFKVYLADSVGSPLVASASRLYAETIGPPPISIYIYEKLMVIIPIKNIIL